MSIAGPAYVALTETPPTERRVGGGGVVFTTIQKFMPAKSGDRNAVLSDRRNIVVIADEAHRSQYDFIDGFARHMRDALPQASFVGFTGTPIENSAHSLRTAARPVAPWIVDVSRLSRPEAWPCFELGDISGTTKAEALVERGAEPIDWSLC